MNGTGGMIMGVDALERVLEPTLLERRYRALLRVLPRAYRARWADDMVDTYVDMRAEAAPDVESWTLGRPGAGDVGDVLSLAVRLRLQAVRGRLDPPAVASARGWGASVRALAAATLLVHAVLALLAVAPALWIAAGLPWLGGVSQDWLDWAGAMLPGGTWRALQFAAPLAWVVAFVALALGRLSWARAWTAVALVPFAIDAGRVLASDVGVGYHFPWSAADWAVRALWYAPLLGLVAFHAEAPQLPRERWLGAFGAGIVGVFALSVLGRDRFGYVDDAGLVCLGAAAGGIVFLALAAARRLAPGGARVAAALVAYAFALRAVTYAAYWHGLSGAGQVRTAVYVEGAALLLVAAPLAVLAARGSRTAA